MEANMDDIRERVSSRGYAEVSDIAEVERALQQSTSAPTLILLGDLIQLLEDPGRYQLSDAENAYLRAVKIEPNHAEGYASLGFFYDRIMDDPAKAKPFFERAVALGSSEALEGLQEVLEQLRDG